MSDIHQLLASKDNLCHIMTNAKHIPGQYILPPPIASIGVT